MKQFSTSAVSTDYFASGFNSVGDNVFSASNGIHIIVPQISGTRNTFDALVVNLENRANVRESHSSSSGVGLSTNLAESAGLMASMNLGTSGSRDTYLNEAYIRGAVDFTRAEVTNQGCCVMDITNSGASYRYVPMEEVHKSRNFAIGLSGLDLSSADAFAYSLGRGLASAAASAGVGMLASEAGLGGFVSTIAASLAGAYVNSEVMPQIRDDNHRPTGLGSNSTVSYEHNGQGFNAINLDFDKSELDAVINKIKENIFTEALDAGASPQEVVEVMQREVEEVEKDIVEFQEQAKEVKKKAEEAKKEHSTTRIEETEDKETQNAVIDLLLNRPSAEECSILERQIWDCFNEVIFDRTEITPQDQVHAFKPKNKAEVALKEATLLRYKLEDFVAKHPEAAELCSKIFVGAMYGLQGIEYAVAGALGGPLGIAAKFATQESTAWAIDTTIEESSNKAAKLITQSEALQREFAGTMKLCTYAGLCAGSVKASKKLVSSLSRNTLERSIYRGGAYGELPATVNTQRHHIVPDSISDVSRNKGSAVQIDIEDHIQTSSWGSSTRAREYRQKLQSMIDEGRIRDAYATDIWDLKSFTGRKYNRALIEMLNYAKRERIIPSKK